MTMSLRFFWVFLVPTTLPKKDWKIWCYHSFFRNLPLYSGWWMNGKVFTILNTSWFSNYGGTKNSVSLTDSEVQTFLEGEKNQYTKRKTESYVFRGFGVGISFGWEWNSTTGRFATDRFWPFTWKTSSVGKDKVNKWEFGKLRITTIVVFVIMIQRISQVGFSCQ